MNRPKKIRIFRRYSDAASKVARFMLEKDSVTLEFKDNTSYRWTNQSAAPENIARMKTLALSGKGLDSFIDSTVKDRYLRKIR
ncbi:MAG: hypothetical protein PHF00_07405 [Elusimicrobia bacterium]|nr:hypothetical protein [Elusimicrobiota bacterium]